MLLTEQNTQSILDAPQVINRAIIYARVSTDEQAESGTSLDNQVEKSLEYAQAQDMQVVGVFKDDITGKILDRPELNKVRAMLRAGQADSLIVYKTNRLDRSEWGINLLLLMQELKQFGIELHYSQDRRQVDLNNPMEAFMYGSFAGWQAGEDHRETVTKLHEGRIGRVKDGYVVIGGKNAPFGYKAIRGEDKKCYLEVYEPEARIVRLIFQLFVFGDETGKQMSIKDIKKRLDTMGIETRRARQKVKDEKSKRTGQSIKKTGATEWNDTQIRRILKRETYAGTWHFRKRFSGGKTRPKRDRIPVEVPAIISPELWQMTQSRFEVQKRRSNNQKNQYLLSGRVKCGCGYAMAGRTLNNGKQSYYYCPGKNGTWGYAQKCNLPLFRADHVEAAIWQWLEEIFTEDDPAKLEERLTGYQKATAEETGTIQYELNLVQKELAEKQAEWEQLVQDHRLATTRRHKERLALDIELIEGQLDALEKRRNDLQTELEEKTVTDDQMTALKEFAAMTRQDWETISGDPDSRRALIDRLDLRVILDLAEDGRKRIRVKGKIAPVEEVLSIEKHPYWRML